MAFKEYQASNIYYQKNKKPIEEKHKFLLSEILNGD